MKFKVAVILSLILHITIFALAFYTPSLKGNSETIFYVDLMQGGGGGNGVKVQENKIEKTEAKASVIEQEKKASLKDLTVKKEIKSKLRYPDKKNKKKKEKEKTITVVRKKKIDKNKKSNKTNSTKIVRKKGSNELSTGISSGNGFGRGGGSGGISNFPYAYYIDTLKSRISSSWYKSLVSPGLRGKFITTVYFKIYRNGRISGLEIEQSSGVKSLDLSALRAVENSSPFPPLPSDFPSRYLIVHFEFLWEK